MTDMEVDMMVNMEGDKMTDMEVDMMVDMEVDKMADMMVYMEDDNVDDVVVINVGHTA